VGGISRSVERDGWRFDIGGHRFFTPLEKVIDAYAEVEQRHTLGKVVLIP
jgi:protoporphyrinogen oxidase